MSRPHPITILFMLVATMLSCADGPDPVAERPAGQTGVARSSEGDDARHYRLVLYDGAALPQPMDLGERCPRIIQGGWLRVTRTHWERADSVTTSCGPDSMPARPQRLTGGTIREVGDTLVLEAQDPELRTTLHVQRALIRGDTLYAGALLFDGPALVYLRR